MCFEAVSMLQAEALLLQHAWGGPHMLSLLVPYRIAAPCPGSYVPCPVVLHVHWPEFTVSFVLKSFPVSEELWASMARKHG
jgi:hypothetical protein